MSIATVDVYGCDYITANGVLYLYIIIGRITPCGGVYHIGVGSSVVCSTVSGNAKASISGTDNSSSTLFCVVTGFYYSQKDTLMKNCLKKFSLFAALLAMSPLLTACGGEGDPESDNPSLTVSSVQVSYSVSLSDTWYKFFNVELSYTASPGETKVDTLDMDKNLNVTYKSFESPSKVSLKIVAKPKANHPDVDDGVTYPIDKDITLKVVGVPSNGGGAVFLFNEPQKSSKTTGSDALRKTLDKEHVLYDQSYTIPK